MVARTRSEVTSKHKAKYRVGDWPAHAAALRARGDLTVWLDEAALAAWNAPPSGRPGGQRRYSDLAVVTVRVTSRRDRSVLALEPPPLTPDCRSLPDLRCGAFGCRVRRCRARWRLWVLKASSAGLRGI
jgi:hypothetical protein